LFVFSARAPLFRFVSLGPSLSILPRIMRQRPAARVRI